MSDTPYLKKTVMLFWFILGGMLIAQSIGYAIGALPVLAGSTFFAPALFEYLVIAWTGWVVLYAIDTVDFLRYVDFEKLEDFFESLNASQSFLFAFICVYINSILLVAALVGFSLTGVLGVKTIGLIAAMLYPNLDLRLMNKYPTPGRLSLNIFLMLFHTFGMLRDVSIDKVISGIEPNSPA